VLMYRLLDAGTAFWLHALETALGQIERAAGRVSAVGLLVSSPSSFPGADRLRDVQCPRCGVAF